MSINGSLSFGRPLPSLFGARVVKVDQLKPAETRTTRVICQAELAEARACLLQAGSIMALLVAVK